MSEVLPQFGQYQTLRVLGEGANGKVYLARHPAFGWDLAIKALTTRRGGNETQRRRFQREIQALARLRHPGLVEVLDGGEEQGVPWFAMRHIKGGSLEERLNAEGPLAPMAVVELGIQLCEALAVAHAHGILHRDLKPDNVLCTKDHFLVADFGLAKDADHEGSTQLSVAGQLLGTPGYWAPEQAIGEGAAATLATDVYGVGGVLYAALTGRPPITGETLMEIVIATQEQPPLPPSDVVESVPKALDDLVLRCLEKSPQARFGSLAGILSGLRGIRANESAAPDPTKGGGRRLLAGILLVGVFLVALFGALILAVLSQRSMPPSPVASTPMPTGPRLAVQGRKPSPKGEDPSDSAARVQDRAALEAVLVDLNRGLVDRQAALLQIVSLTNAGTVDIVLLRLNEIVAKMEASRRELLLDLADAGTERDLVRALDVVVERPRQRPNDRDRIALDTARWKLIKREFDQVRTLGIQRDGSAYLRLLGDHLEKRVGRQELVVAQVLCEALGSAKVGASKAQVLEALAFYVLAEGNALRAIPAGLAFLQVSGKDGHQELWEFRDRFGVSNPFTEAIDKALRDSKVAVEVELESETFEGYSTRGRRLHVLGKPKEALADLNAALRLRPDDALALSLKASCLAEVGDRREALRLYGRILELDPKNYVALYNRARLRQRLGDFSGANQDFERGIAEVPRVVEFRSGRVEVLLALGRLDEALEDGEQAVALGPTEPFNWHVRGVSRLRTNDFQGAVEDFTRSLELDTTRKLAVSNFGFRGEAYLNLGESRASLRDLEQAAEGNPQEPQYVFLVGVAHARLGETEAGIRAFTKTIELRPLHSFAWANRGLSRVRLGDLQGACRDLSKAAELAPDQAHVWLSLADAQLGLKDFKGALASANACLEKSTSPGARAYYDRARAWIGLNRNEEARTDLLHFLELSPRHASAPAARELLDSLAQ